MPEIKERAEKSEMENIVEIDLPACSFKNCRYNKDHSCTRPDEHEKCSRGKIFALTEKVYEKYPDDQDIWILLQEIARIGQCINEINAKGGRSSWERSQDEKNRS